MMAHKDKVVGELTKGVEFLLKKNKAEAIVGEARIAAPGKVEVKAKDGAVRTLETKHIVIATGSDVTPLPGVTIDEEQIVSSTGALALKSVPKRLLVVGGGYIGLELGSVWRRLGSEVTVVEFLDRITPGLDGEIGKQFQRILHQAGHEVPALDQGRRRGEDGRRAQGHASSPRPAASSKTIETDIMLVSIGRRPYTRQSRPRPRSA